MWVEKGSTVAFQCVKMHSRTKTGRKQTGLFKFPDNVQSQNFINCGVIKSKHSEKPEGKICLKLQITHMYANFILILLI